MAEKKSRQNERRYKMNIEPSYVMPPHTAYDSGFGVLDKLIIVFALSIVPSVMIMFCAIAICDAIKTAATAESTVRHVIVIETGATKPNELAKGE